VLLDQFHNSEARLLRTQDSLVYSPTDSQRYVNCDAPTNKEPSTDARPVNIGVDHSLSYARKAIREITELGRMRLEERKSSEKAENTAVQDSDVTSTTSADTDEVAETHRSDSPADNIDNSTENTTSSSPPSSTDQVSSSSQDTSDSIPAVVTQSK